MAPPKILVSTLMLVSFALVLASGGVPLSQEPAGEASVPRIAIVGAGIGGTSAAFYLHQLFSPGAGEGGELDEDLQPPVANVTVFELGVVGGRLATVHIAGHEYEVGGSVIHPANKFMRDLVEELGLRERPSVGYVGKWQLDRFSMHQFHEVVFKASAWTLPRLWQLISRYGIFDLEKMRRFISTLLSNFGLIYPFLESGNHVDEVSDLLLRMSPSARFISSSVLLNNTDLSLMRRMLDLGMSRQLVDELAMVAVNVNYGQSPHAVHALVGAVALAGAEDGLWAVDGGNKRVAEQLLERSKANYAQAQVSSVGLNPDGTLKVAFNRLATPAEPEWLFAEGANEGKSQKVPVSTAEEKEDFDVVILATPMTKDKTTIEIRGLPEPPSFPRRYHRTVTTLVNGEVDPKALGFDSEEDMTAANFYIDRLDNLNSLSLLAPVTAAETDGEDLPRVWKIFSKTPLTDEDLDAIFQSRQETKVVDWLAYPHYRVQQQSTLGSFKLHEGLYHVNAVEWAASAMEMSVIGGRNCANAAHKLLSERLKGPAEAQDHGGFERDETKTEDVKNEL